MPHTTSLKQPLMPQSVFKAKGMDVLKMHVQQLLEVYLIVIQPLWVYIVILTFVVNLLQQQRKTKKKNQLVFVSINSIQKCSQLLFSWSGKNSSCLERSKLKDYIVSQTVYMQVYIAILTSFGLLFCNSEEKKKKENNSFLLLQYV